MASAVEDEGTSFLSPSDSKYFYTKLTMIQRKTKVVPRFWKFLLLFFIIIGILYFVKIFQLDYSQDYYYDFNEIPVEIISARIAIEDRIESYDAAKMEFLNYKLDYHVKKLPIDCKNKKYLIIIPSRSSGFHNRMAIRKSWLHNEVR